MYLTLFIDFSWPTNDSSQAFSFIWLLYFPTGTILFYHRFLSVTSSCFGPLMLQKPNDVSSAMYLIFTSIFCPLYFLSCLLPRFFLSKLLRVVFFDAVHFAHPLFCVIDVFLFFSSHDICRNYYWFISVPLVPGLMPVEFVFGSCSLYYGKIIHGGCGIWLDLGEVIRFLHRTFYAK